MESNLSQPAVSNDLHRIWKIYISDFLQFLSRKANSVEDDVGLGVTLQLILVTKSQKSGLSGRHFTEVKL